MKDRLINPEKAAIFFVNSIQNGGAERVVINQVKELSRQGIQVFLLTIHDACFYEVEKEIKYIVLFKYTSGVKKILSIPFIVQKLDEQIDNIFANYEVVLLTTHLPYAHLICNFSKYRRKFLYVMHNSQAIYENYQKSSFKMKTKVLYDDKRIIAVSEGVKNELINVYGLKSEKIKTIYNPIDFNDMDNKIHMDTSNTIINAPYIMYAGRLIDYKGVDRLIQAYKKSELTNDYLLIILGSGPEERNLKKLAEELDLIDRVIFVGWENNIYKWMNNAKLLVCSSDYESFGMVLVEALYCNCRVVSVDCDFGPREILIGELRPFLSKIDINDLAKKMQSALEKYPDEKKKYVDKFDVKNIMRQYLEYYVEG